MSDDTNQNDTNPGEAQEQPTTLLNQQPEGQAEDANRETQGPEGDEGKGSEEAATTATGAPETYDLGAGEDVAAETVQSVEAFARANDMTNDQAKAVLADRQEQAEAFEVGQREAFNAKVEAWENEVKSDPDMGGDKYPDTIADAKRAMDHFATDEFRNTLEESGLGSNPGVVRMMAKIGRAMKESRLRAGQPAGETRQPQD